LNLAQPQARVPLTSFSIGQNGALNKPHIFTYAAKKEKVDIAKTAIDGRSPGADPPLGPRRSARASHQPPSSKRGGGDDSESDDMPLPPPPSKKKKQTCGGRDTKTSAAAAATAAAARKAASIETPNTSRGGTTRDTAPHSGPRLSPIFARMAALEKRNEELQQQLASRPGAAQAHLSQAGAPQVPLPQAAAVASHAHHTHGYGTAPWQGHAPPPPFGYPIAPWYAMPPPPMPQYMSAMAPQHAVEEQPGQHQQGSANASRGGLVIKYNIQNNF
jgi:hypothetical protein